MNHTNHTWEFILRLLLAGGLGAAIGLERKAHYKQAGLRTHFVVAIGSALMMIVSQYGFMGVVNGKTVIVDPSRIAAQVVSGIGFLGAGIIIFQRNAIRGLTTAAGVWTVAGIGLATGAGMYVLAIVCTALVLFGFIALRPVERKIFQNVQHITITADDRPGLIGKIGAALEILGVHIEQMSIDRTEEEGDLVDIELYLRMQKQSTGAEKMKDFLTEIDGIKQIRFP